jgi:YbbR domain-containing protein
MNEMLSRFGTNLRTFLWALALALAVWVAAVTSADPDEVHAYPLPIKIEVVGQDPGLIISGDMPQTVGVTLRAPRSVWDQLNAHPESVRAILDLSGLSAGQHELPLQIQVSIRPVRIISANPSNILLTLEPLLTRSLPIDLNLSGQPAIGYQAGNTSMDQNEAIVAGPKSQVEKVKRLIVSLNLDGIRSSVNQSLNIQAVDENNTPITGLTIHPETVKVSLPVSQQGGYRDLAVKVIVHGQVANGYRLNNISVFPPVVTVYSSDPAVVNALPGAVETQPLDLQDVNDNLTTRLQLNLPQGVSVVGEQTVLIQAGVSPIQSSLTLSGEKVEVIGLSAGMTAQVSPNTVDVILSGPLPLLDTLTRQDVQVTVDVTGLDIGTHQLTPKVNVLITNVNVESLLPGTVEVIITPGPLPTPTH